jgi:hypothetical protein
MLPYEQLEFLAFTLDPLPLSDDYDDDDDDDDYDDDDDDDDEEDDRGVCNFLVICFSGGFCCGIYLESSIIYSFA